MTSVFKLNDVLKTIEFDEKKVDICYINTHMISSHSNSLTSSRPFQGENDEAMKGADV